MDQLKQVCEMSEVKYAQEIGQLRQDIYILKEQVSLLNQQYPGHIQ
jgi:hypothetical protein